MRIKVLVFDLGKVVFDVSFERCFEYWARVSGQSVEDLRNRFSFEGAYTAFETGAINKQQFRRDISEQLQMSMPDHEFDAGWCSLYQDVFPEVETLLIELRNKYTLVALTNTNEIHEMIWMTKYQDVLRNFQEIYASHHLRMRKPDPRIFHHVLNSLHCSPNEALFADDNLENIKAAENLGIHTVLVTSPNQAVHDIGTTLILN